MGSARSPKALPRPGLLLGGLLLAFAGVGGETVAGIPQLLPPVRERVQKRLLHLCHFENPSDASIGELRDPALSAALVRDDDDVLSSFSKGCDAPLLLAAGPAALAMCSEGGRMSPAWTRSDRALGKGEEACGPLMVQPALQQRDWPSPVFAWCPGFPACVQASFWNWCGQAWEMACQAEVQVSVPPVVEALLGQDVSLWCKHTATGADNFLMVEWFITDRNGEHRRVAYSEDGHRGVDKGTDYTDRVSMDADNSLVIRAMEVSDERNFTCRVMASASGSSEAAAHLKVYGPPEPPEVTDDHRTLSVTEEAASEVAQCESRNANPLPTISWYKDGRPLNAPTERNRDLYVVSRTVTEASGLHSISSKLFLRPTKADKDSHFRCQVSYSMPHGEVVSNFSRPFQLKLHYYTENVRFVLTSPEVIKEGDDVQLHCEGDGHPPSEMVFFKVEAGNAVEDLGAKSDGILLLSQVTKADSGTYRCQVLDFDSPGEVNLEQEVTIDVNYLDPLVLSPDKSVVVNLGESIELSCSATSSQTPKFSWRKGKEQVGDGETLALTSLTYHMAGAYTCEASVPSIPGLRRDKTVRVIVEGTPELEPRPSRSHYRSLGQLVKLTCSALGHPEPVIRWSEPGTVSVNSSGNRVTSELSVEVDAKLAQQGVTCQAKNNHGTVEQRFQLEIGNPVLRTVDGQESQGGSTVAVIAVCVCVLLLLLIVGFFYFMQRRGCLPCGGGEKRSLTPKEGNPDDTLVEMKTDKRNEQTGLLSPGGGGGGGPNEACRLPADITEPRPSPALTPETHKHSLASKPAKVTGPPPRFYRPDYRAIVHQPFVL
ncbi:hypothetical protein lerEdw1_009956 [Lerista edwardsae]|nr:hypothetical protein lerEdw1_009956 [Lerista edwardsae]